MSLKTKFILIFLLITIIPLGLATGVGYYQIKKINELTIKQTQKMAEIENTLKLSIEKLVEQRAEDIVKMAKAYIEKVKKERGEINWEELQYDPEFLSIGVQSIGKTGYSAMQIKKGDKIIVFLHANPKLIGVVLNPFEKTNPVFWRIVKGPKPGERMSKGYYPWKEPDGHIEKKFMVVMPVPGTPLFATATIYTKEIEVPLKQLKTQLLSAQKRFLLQFIIGGAVIIILVIIVAIIFATRLSKPILHLTEVAERISLGELNAPVEITSTDEIGDLADAIRRMQASLRKAIQRLQRRLHR